LLSFSKFQGNVDFTGDMNKNNISELSPDTTPPRAWPDASTPRSKRFSRRTKSQRAEKTVRQLQILIVILIAVMVISAFAVGSSVQPLRSQRDALSLEVLRLERDLAVSKEELKFVVAERDELVTTRIPGLESLAFDETITVERDYVRNILFTMTVQRGQSAYEFRLVLANDELSDVIPNVSVLLFNQLGIQVGAASVSLKSLSMETGLFKLAPGDVRSYSGRVDLLNATEPTYYVLDID